MKLPFRLLAVDIDGTLLNSSFAISSRDLAGLRRAHELGIEVILCTGRRHSFALPVAHKLGFELWLCSSNGAVTRSSQGEDFHRDLMPANVARDLCAHMKSFRGGTVLTFDRETKGALVVERTDELVATVQKWVEKNWAYIEHVSSLEEALLADPIQAMFCGNLVRMKEAQDVISEFPRRSEVSVLKTEYEHRDLCLLDVLNRDCSKGHAVKRWARERRIPAAEVMAIGDNYNDVEMLQFAAFPVIMANSSDDLKQHGWMETLSNDQSGIAHALETVLGSELMALESASTEEAKAF